MTKNNYAIIMAGGIGSRFWPWSRTEQPKQFLDVLGTGKTLIQQTFDRISQICPKENILVITNARYAQTIAAQIPDMPAENILSEPQGKNTAPCVALGAFKIHKKNSEANILVAPSDHIILKEELFAQVVNRGFDYSGKNDVLMTIGIEPHKPETGYGYIQSSGNIVAEEKNRWVQTEVTAFREKPDLATAQNFLADGRYFWNAGIFIWSAKSILKAFLSHLPQMHNLFAEYTPDFDTIAETKAIEQIFGRCDSISIDYGIMEKAKNVQVISTDIGWSDLGSWSALHEISNKDVHENTTNSEKTLFYDANNCIVRTLNNKVTVIEGLKDYVVVEEENALLICRKQNEQRIKEFVKDVSKKFGDQYV
ncbi:MAG: sugar phosphate nucleotidyltransferase [Salinivirgaceae bacterium]|jgi:mannose-1-phosphate guanylyltransferase|nr:sugar phosphate nucleotidyltransferase [Salinivirgaceae bacterium]